MLKLYLKTYQRLINSVEYKHTLNKTHYKFCNKKIICFVHKNSYLKLGLIISKANIKNAFERNKIKRVIRNSFRLKQHNVYNIHIIILANIGLEQLNNKSLCNEFNNLYLLIDK